MTTHPMTCDQFADALAPYLERELDEVTSAALEAHAARCAECGSLLADLARLRTEAARLPELHPSRDLWEGIEARIAPQVVSLSGRQATRDAARQPATRRWLRPTAAAAALVIATAGITYSITRAVLQNDVAAPRVATSGSVNPAASVPSTDSTFEARHPTTNAATPSTERRTPNQRFASDPQSGPRTSGSDARSERAAPVGSSGAVLAANRGVDRATAEEHEVERAYGVEIARLHALVDQRRSRLDSSTVAVIERNLAIIDAAIAESRAALARDPASSFLIQQLNSALDRKVDLLRTAATLPSRT